MILWEWIERFIEPRNDQRGDLADLAHVAHNTYTYAHACIGVMTPELSWLVTRKMCTYMTYLVNDYMNSKTK